MGVDGRLRYAVETLQLATTVEVTLAQQQSETRDRQQSEDEEGDLQTASDASGGASKHEGCSLVAAASNQPEHLLELSKPQRLGGIPPERSSAPPPELF